MVILYILISVILMRFIQVIGSKLVYGGKINFKLMVESGYVLKDRWKIWIGDLIGITSGYIVFSSMNEPIGSLILKIILLIVLMFTFSTDVRDQYILDIYTLPAILIFLIGRVFVQDYVTWVYLAGGFGIAILLGVIMFLMVGKMGGGDFKLFIALGFYFGIFDLLTVLFISSLTGLVYGGYLYYKNKESRPFAFGPFIVLGVLLMLLFDFNILAL